MKCLKEPLSRLANREEKTGGAFFEGRFKSVAILDVESLLATCAYIDLNPVAAGIAEVPEASEHTSIKQRVEHVKEQGRTEDLKAAQTGSVAGSTAAAGLEEGLWLLPDRGSKAAGFVTRRDARRILAGQLRAAGGIHRAVVPRGQSRGLR